MKRVISLDSTGTLLRIPGSVGQHYTRILDSFYPGALTPRDKTMLISQFNSNFPLYYQDAMREHPNFGHGSIGCYEWWRQLVRKIYLASHVDIKCYQFSYVFDDTYNQFRSKSCWEMYPETLSVLRELQKREYDVVVTSDFDNGLSNILQEHGLYNPEDISNSLIKEVITSYKEGVTKPDLVGLVRERWRMLSVHVGDSVRRDVVGAEESGVAAIFVDRTGKGDCHDRCPSVLTLEGVLDHV